MTAFFLADPCAPVRAAYDQILATSRQHATSDSIPIFTSVDSVLRRRRSSCFPPVPENINDVAINGEWAHTWNDRQFLSHVDNGWGLAVFATERQMRILAACQTIFVDGTFRSAPFPYMQMVTFHGLYLESVVPLSVVKVSRGPAPAPLNLASYGPGSCFVGPGSYFQSPGCCAVH
jgi:hypothetical protein